uniref:Uncharacterized protein n=1 Tax=Arundo donax TaxID=35708 RepID=A0A0A9HAE2_ARUDO
MSLENSIQCRALPPQAASRLRLMYSIVASSGGDSVGGACWRYL